MSAFPAIRLRSGPAASGQLQSRGWAPLNVWGGWISAGPLRSGKRIEADIVIGPAHDPRRKRRVSEELALSGGRFYFGAVAEVDALDDDRRPIDTEIV